MTTLITIRFEYNYTELQDFNETCFFEENSMLCDKELSDRGDLAELLRLQSELLLRTDYLKNANLFASDVQSEHDQYERDTLIEKVFQADSS